MMNSSRSGAFSVHRSDYVAAVKFASTDDRITWTAAVMLKGLWFDGWSGTLLIAQAVDRNIEQTLQLEIYKRIGELPA